MAKLRHRGRIQAQGGGLEASENWAQNEPLTGEEGLSLLQRLRNKISGKEADDRAEQFEKAEDMIRRLKDNGGIDAHFSQSFRKKGTDLRVDIEVLGGRAFVCLAIFLLIILWLLR
jgi:hypothetical protein